MTIITSILIFLILVSSAGLRCIVPGTPTQELSKSEAVFTGQVIGREYVKDTSLEQDSAGERLVIKLSVDKIWKGKIGKEVLMYTSEVRYPNGVTSMMAEDFHFEDEKKYLIYANGSMEKLRTSACTRSRKLEKAELDFIELGEGQEPKGE